MIKKKLLSMLCVAAIMVSFSGCGNVTTSDNASETTKKAEDDSKFNIVLVAKQEGIPWFDDMRTGVEEFAKTYSDKVEAKQIAPEGGDSAKQVQMVEDLIAQGVDAICVVPNDPAAMAPVLKKAREKGIVVISHEAPGLTDAVDYDVEAIDNKVFGELLFEQLAENMGGKGKFAAMVGGLTMTTHMEWYDAGMAYIKEKYPDMEAVSEQPYEDKNDDTTARNKALEILNANPDITGFVGTSVSAGSNMAAVLEEKNNKNISVVSLGIPSVSGPYLESGFMKYAQTWRPADAGYASCLAALKLLEGESIETGLNLDKKGYDNCTIDGQIIYGNAPLVLEKDTYPDGSYPF